MVIHKMNSTYLLFSLEGDEKPQWLTEAEVKKYNARTRALIEHVLRRIEEVENMSFRGAIDKCKTIESDREHIQIEIKFSSYYEDNQYAKAERLLEAMDEAYKRKCRDIKPYAQPEIQPLNDLLQADLSPDGLLLRVQGPERPYWLDINHYPEIEENTERVQKYIEKTLRRVEKGKGVEFCGAVKKVEIVESDMIHIKIRVIFDCDGNYYKTVPASAPTDDRRPAAPRSKPKQPKPSTKDLFRVVK